MNSKILIFLLPFLMSVGIGDVRSEDQICWRFRLSATDKPLTIPEKQALEDCFFDRTGWQQPMPTPQYPLIPVFTAKDRHCKRVASLHWTDPFYIPKGMDCKLVIPYMLQWCALGRAANYDRHQVYRCQDQEFAQVWPDLCDPFPQLVGRKAVTPRELRRQELYDCVKIKKMKTNWCKELQRKYYKSTKDEPTCDIVVDKRLDLCLGMAEKYTFERPY